MVPYNIIPRIVSYPSVFCYIWSIVTGVENIYLDLFDNCGWMLGMKSLRKVADDDYQTVAKEMTERNE